MKPEQRDLANMKIIMNFQRKKLKNWQKNVIYFLKR